MLGDRVGCSLDSSGCCGDPLLSDFVEGGNVGNVREGVVLFSLIDICEEDFVHLHWELERDTHELGAQIGGKTTVSFQGQLQL